MTNPITFVKEQIKRSSTLYRLLKPAKDFFFPLPEAVQYPGVFGKIHHYDYMVSGFDADALKHYEHVGLQIYGFIEEGLRLVGRSIEDTTDILDYGCGYGRGTRILAQKIPPQKISVFDVDPGAPRFCAKEFGVTPIYYKGDWNKVPFKSYDAIFLDSVFTHLGKATTPETLLRLYGILKPDGVLIFTTHGEEALRRLHVGEYGERYKALEPEILQVLEKEEFAFFP